MVTLYLYLLLKISHGDDRLLWSSNGRPVTPVFCYGISRPLNNIVTSWKFSVIANLFILVAHLLCLKMFTTLA